MLDVIYNMLLLKTITTSIICVSCLSCDLLVCLLQRRKRMNMSDNHHLIITFGQYEA